jgi:hypothetical protein
MPAHSGGKPRGDVPKTDPSQPDAPLPVPAQPVISDPPPSQSDDLHDPVEPQPVD